MECGYHIPSDTKICKRDGLVDFREIILPASYTIYRCKNCGHKESTQPLKKRISKVNEDILFNGIPFDRKMINSIRDYRKNNNSNDLISDFFHSVKNKNYLDKLDEFIFPEPLFNEILNNTNCDKFVEKSNLKSIIYWFLSTFMSGNLENLAINAVSRNSERNLSRNLTNNSVISPNALGVRLEKEQLILALEQLLQVCAGLMGTEVFSENETLRPVYYDWMYITKSGDSWVVCNKMPHGDDFRGFKIGVGVDWISKAVVSLVFHGEEHPHDSVSFQRDLCIKDIPGLINITDRGPFDTKFMELIIEKSQFFIIRLKDNIKYRIIHMKKNQNQDYVLQISSKPKIKILETGLIKLTANPNLPALKYIKFQHNNKKTGRFETIELISNLSLDNIDIIELSAQRWRATETEFNILQHGFGLEKVFVRDPRKVWPLFLISLICKSIFEMILNAIHGSHGGKLDIGDFKANLGIILEYITSNRGSEPPLSPCDAVLCPYRRKRGLRWI